ncbi:carbohydrate sulfotransferase 10-like [Penaeus chinensis]|uniref:carbohydrate sulfotransferase 10-like n=1 Tax=Penaeus chinensis TaxID=139456 RepID=UPI001FB5771A|nr:carbohydrate sulfotransferase 10-like [Penaeus chinensis]
MKENETTTSVKENETTTSVKENETTTSVKENEAENESKENEAENESKENEAEKVAKENETKTTVKDKLAKESETETLLKENESGILVKENGTDMKMITESHVGELNVTSPGVSGIRRLMTQEEYLRVKKIHQDRISLVKERCEKFTPTATRGLTALINRGSHYKLGNKLFLPQDVINSNFQIDETHRVTFCWQYKVGSTAWNAMFAYLLNQTSVIRRKTFYDMRKIMTVKTMKEFKKSMDFYKFLIVREPLERLLSAYRDRIEDTSHRSWQRDNYVPKILKVTRPHLKSADIRVNGSLVVIPTFREFVEYLLVTPIGNYDPHWRPYWKHCAPCVVSFQAIGRAETQAQDIRFILEDSGLAREIDNTVLEQNAHHGRGSTHDLLVSYYSTLDISTLEKLYRRYEVDYFIFGYDIQLLLDELHPHRNISFKSRF